jgi:polyisoprenoid-binding protein YceI
MKWEIDRSHADASFSVKHMGIMNVRGSFKDVEGHVIINDLGDLTEFHADILVKSITTRDESRDAHLLGEDFFDSSNHPNMVFNSTFVKKIDDSNYEVTGDLNTRGLSKPITINVLKGREIKDLFGFKRVALEGTAEIDRRDWNMKWNQILDNGGLLVGNAVKIIIDCEIITKL